MDDLVRFLRQYPEIDLNVMVSYDVFDIARREADIAIRIIGRGRSPPEELVGRKLVTTASCYYASGAYLKRHDPWASDTTARFIGWGDSARFPRWVKDSPFPHVPAYGNLNNVMLQISAASAGMGIATLPCFAGDASASLRRVPGTRPYDNDDIWLLSHPDLRDSARLRLFRKFVTEALEKKEELLRGLRPKK
jgi:DNA-binding transcriptional LysR family regulator